MDPSYHFFSLPSEIRDEIYFYLITLIFDRCGRYTYHGGIDRRVLNVGLYGNHQYKDPTKPEKSNELAHILGVSHQMKAEVQSLLYRHFSIYLTPDYIRHWFFYNMDDVFRPRNWSLVRNLIWQCFMVDSVYDEGVIFMYHPVTRSEVEQLVECLPGLSQVDILLHYPAPNRDPTAVISLTDMFTQVLDMTVYIEEGLENLNEKVERMNMNRTHRFQVKIVSSPFSIKFIISS
jgi:hypothetical protein